MNEELFTGKTIFYEMARPEVSKDAVDYLCSLLPQNAVFADVGAGTGKFTTLIAERGYFIYAVEPNSDMYTVLSNKMKKYTNVKLLNRSAENTEIPSKSVDVIVAVTALHWFDLDAFKMECLRILKPNGIVVVIYNSRRSELEKVNVDLKKTATELFFNGHYNTYAFPNEQSYSREEFVAYHLSHSSSPNKDDKKYNAYINQLNFAFDKSSINDKYIFDFVSVLYVDSKFLEHNSK